MTMPKFVLLVLMPLIWGMFEPQAFPADLKGLVWTYAATVEPQSGMPIQVNIELVSLKLEQTQAEVAIVRTPWQTEVEMLFSYQWPSEFGELEEATKSMKIGTICAWCWPAQLFELLPLLEEPFPYFGQFLQFLSRLLPFTLYEDGEEEAAITFSITAPIKLESSQDGINFIKLRFGIDIKFGGRTFVETPIGKLKLLPVQFKVFGTNAYIFTTWCLPDELPMPWMAPVKGEGRVEEAGVVTTVFRWELVRFEDLDSTAIRGKLKQALAEMVQTAPGKAEDVQRSLKELGIEISY